ncbi:MAG: DUF4870 domain-containing protein [Halioglobus sp.]|nr:DUF4870 domain-containing protein [Halioglobus sp.]
MNDENKDQAATETQSPEKTEIGSHRPASQTSDADRPWGMELNAFCMLMHLSQLAGFLVPGAGLVLPIVMWATNRDQHPEINLHGLIILNWLLSALIYSIVCFVLIFVLIGFPMLLALAICAIVFAIIGGVKANEGIYWRYPASIDFFSVKARLGEAT